MFLKMLLLELYLLFHLKGLCFSFYIHNDHRTGRTLELRLISMLTGSSVRQQPTHGIKNYILLHAIIPAINIKNLLMLHTNGI